MLMPRKESRKVSLPTGPWSQEKGAHFNVQTGSGMNTPPQTNLEPLSPLAPMPSFLVRHS